MPLNALLSLFMRLVGATIPCQIVVFFLSPPFPMALTIEGGAKGGRLSEAAGIVQSSAVRGGSLERSRASYYLENSKVKMTFASNGEVTGIAGKNGGSRLLSARHYLASYDDDKDTGIPFDRLSISGNSIRLANTATQFTVILDTEISDDYFLFTIKSVLNPADKSVASISLRLNTTLKDVSTVSPKRKFYASAGGLTLIGMPFSPNVSASVRAGTGFITLKAEAYGDFATSLVNSKCMLMTVAGKPMSFETEDALMRIKTRFGMRNSALSDTYLPTLFTWADKPIADVADPIIDYANQTGFKNILIWSGYWSAAGGYPESSLNGWDVNPEYFSGSRLKLKWFIDRIHAAGLKAGLHFLPLDLPEESPLAHNVAARLRCHDGANYVREGSLYTINLNDNSVINEVAQGYADIVNYVGADLVYLDGIDAIPYGKCLPDLAAYYHENNFVNILRSKLTNPAIRIQASQVFPYFQPFLSGRQSFTDGYGCPKTASCNDIRGWIDGAGRWGILNIRNMLITPELGWIYYMPDLDKPVSDYEYLLSAAIAYGVPVTFENSWLELQRDPGGKFQAALRKYLMIYNQYADKSILVETNSQYDATQYRSGLVAFSVRKSTGLPAGPNRVVWIHVELGAALTVKLHFSNLSADSTYILNGNGRSSKLKSDRSGRIEVAVPITAGQNYNLFTLNPS